MTSPHQSPDDRLARMHQAVDDVLRSVGLSPDAFQTRQTTPTHAKARQTTPPLPILQNEPTGPEVALPAPLTTSNTRQSAPNPANAHHPITGRKTNLPPDPAPLAGRPPRPLTPIQLRAAHLLVAGHATTAIAATLAIDRHTLAAWKNKPLFQAELRRLVEASFDSPTPRS